MFQKYVSRHRRRAFAAGTGAWRGLIDQIGVTIVGKEGQVAAYGSKRST